VQKVFAVIVLAAGLATSAQAQQAWQKEIGIQGGFARVQAAGTGADPTDLFFLPGGTVLVPVLSYAPLYAIFPWKEKIAIEPSLGHSTIQVGGQAIMTLRVGLRGDYALSPKFYVAAGGVFSLAEQSSDTTSATETQVGLQLAAGYRIRFTSRINGRIEAQWVTTKGSDLNPAFNAYQVLFGMSSRIGGSSAPTARRSAGAANQAWSSVIGVNAGVSRTHAVGGGNIITISAPAIGGQLAALGVPAPTMSGLFAILPIGTKTALEPGIDFARVKLGTSDPSTSAMLGLRLNYAVSGNWYAAGGVNLNYIKPGAGNSISLFGGNVAWGYRFRLGGDLGGRIELNYLTFPHNDDLQLATNTVGILFGATVPLK